MSDLVFEVYDLNQSNLNHRLQADASETCSSEIFGRETQLHIRHSSIPSTYNGPFLSEAQELGKVADCVKGYMTNPENVANAKRGLVLTSIDHLLSQAAKAGERKFTLDFSESDLPDVVSVAAQELVKKGVTVESTAGDRSIKASFPPG